MISPRVGLLPGGAQRFKIRNDPDPFEFDDAPLQAYIDRLSVQQKKLLLNRKVVSGGRLVVFITVYRQKPLRMCADFGPGRGSAHPNATFSVFHCTGVDGGATLVCHTEHFLVNLTNGPTNTWLHSPQRGKAAKDWLKKSNAAPPLFKIGAMFPQPFCDGVLWSRMFTAAGTPPASTHRASTSSSRLTGTPRICGFGTRSWA